MLEHLLLLPRNAPLFAERRLHTVVLDEIHTYAGAQAIEVAYLLRKLRNKLRLAHPVQCIGTSASMARARTPKPRPSASPRICSEPTLLSRAGTAPDAS